VSRQITALVAGVLCLVVVLLAAASGWLGGVVACGADRAPGCVPWPPALSYLAWAAFLLGVAALVVWQFHYLDK
jgi:hypothetical protein